MHKFIQSVCELIKDNETFVMATVVKATGSTPRTSGAKMVVRPDGSIFGTVGGGLVEATACKEGEKLLADGAGDGEARLIYVDMTNELAAESDMICGGGQTVLLEVLEPTGPCALAYVKLDDLMRRGVRSVLSTRLEGRDELKATNHVILTRKLDLASTSLDEDGQGRNLLEPFVPAPPLFIFGAGHVSLFTAKVTSMIGFRTVVLDDREDFANVERFPEVAEVKVLESFKNCCELLPIDEESYVIIVTRGHLHDRNVLAEVLKTPAKYVGMIGSTRKRDKIYESLLEDGFSQNSIDRCHCPIGLTIGAQTPEEIAVSIAAELIQVRAGEIA